MPALSLQYRELLPPGVELELDQLITTINAAFETDHDGDTGKHAAVQLDSLTANDTNLLLPLTGTLKILKGRIYLDEPGNNTHIAGVRPLQLTANVHNYNPPGGKTALIIEVTSDADRSVTGLERYDRQKQLVIFGNRGNFNITLEHDHASSTSSNRFGLPANTDVVLGASEYILLYYDVGSEIWRAVSFLG